MALSVCCTTSTPARAVAGLGPLRDVAQEIVVAVDVSGGERDLSPLGTVADCVFEIELDGFPEPAMAWLHERCTGEWILRVDDDEILDAELLERLPELTRARDVAQYWLARRWLYPDARRWLAEWPWFPDFQGRLVRNDPLLWFPGLCHTNIAPGPPARYLDYGLYHLVHLLATRREREAKVERYHALDPTMRASEADPYLRSYYVPERHLHARIAPVDLRDHHPIDTALASMGNAVEAGANSNAEECASDSRRVPRQELHSHWARRALDSDGYRASIRPVDVHRQLVADDHRPFRVLVHNDGSEWWPGGEQRSPLIRVAYRWLKPDGSVSEAEGFRTALPHPVGPGESCLVSMNVTAPTHPGRYLLAPDLVHEHVRWFQCDAEPVEMLVGTHAARTR